jgi:hypothetical protein
MRSVFYKRDKLITQSIGCLVLAAGGLWLAIDPDFHAKFRFVGGFLALCLPFVSIALFHRWRQNHPALAYDQHSVSLSTLYRSASFAWQDVRDIQREKLTQSSGFGLIKQDIAHYLVITVADGSSLEEYRIQEDILDWPRERFDALQSELVDKWMMSAGQPKSQPTLMQAPSMQPSINGQPLVSRPGAVQFGRKSI